jgi:hypothetical protein
MMLDDLYKQTAGGATPTAGEDLQVAKRRSVRRCPLVASAEVTELGSGAQLKARTSELGLGGCYIDTLNPFPPRDVDPVADSQGHWSLRNSGQGGLFRREIRDGPCLYRDDGRPTVTTRRLAGRACYETQANFVGSTTLQQHSDLVPHPHKLRYVPISRITVQVEFTYLVGASIHTGSIRISADN